MGVVNCDGSRLVVSLRLNRLRKFYHFSANLRNLCNLREKLSRHLQVLLINFIQILNLCNPYNLCNLNL